MTLSCTNKFGLLEPHVCSYDPELPPPPPPVSHRVPLASVQPQAHLHGYASSSSESSLKRKASAASSADHPPEKRTRTDGSRDGGLDVRSASSVERTLCSVPVYMPQIQPEYTSSKLDHLPLGHHPRHLTTRMRPHIRQQPRATALYRRILKSIWTDLCDCSKDTKRRSV